MSAGDVSKQSVSLRGSLLDFKKDPIREIDWNFRKSLYSSFTVNNKIFWNISM